MKASETCRKRPRLDVALAAIRIDQRAVRAARHRIDGQIAPREILLERDLGSEFDVESAIARRDFPLATRERIFFVAVGMQEDREVAAHLAIAELQQLLARSADDHPVALPHRHAEHGVSNRTADQIHLHA